MIDVECCLLLIWLHALCVFVCRACQVDWSELFLDLGFAVFASQLSEAMSADLSWATLALLLIQHWNFNQVSGCGCVWCVGVSDCARVCDFFP